ncbi:MAG: hypothetical protein ACR2IE_06585 [Candidatus Sumerlaeaceae bacterium]
MVSQIQESVFSSLDLLDLDGRDEEVRSLVVAREYRTAALLCLDLYRETVPLAKYTGAEDGANIERQRTRLLGLIRNIYKCVDAVRPAQSA